MDQENSVVIAISELQKLEQQRLAQEAQAKERERIECERAQARKRAEQERARRLAESEAREKIAFDLRRRNVELDTQVAALRSELAAVQAARQEIRLRLLAGYPTQITEIRSSRLGLKLVGAVVVGSAITLLAVYFLSPTHPSTVESEFEHSKPREESIRVEQKAAAFSINKTDKTANGRPDEPRTGRAQGETIPLQKVKSKPRDNSRPRPGKPKDSKKSGDLLGDLDNCGDDPTCGLPVAKDKQSNSR